MKWIQDISSTGFFSLIFGIGLVIISFVCAEYGKKKGYSYWLCFLCCILGKITGIICIVILPDIVKMEEQEAASFRYRDKEIEKLKAECEAQKRRISQLEGKQEIDK